MNLGWVFINMARQRGQAGTTAQARQPFEQDHAGNGCLNALATITGRGWGVSVVNGIDHGNVGV